MTNPWEPPVNQTTCSVCGELQFMTDNGLTCNNGHGGADGNPVPTEELPPWLTSDIKMQLQNRNLPLNKDGMLLLWQQTKAAFDRFKESEIEYRKICAGFLVAEQTVSGTSITSIANEGMNNVELGNGYVAKVGVKFNYNLNSDNDVIWKSLEKIENVGNEGKFIAERLVSWTPNFLKTEYTTLQENADKGSNDAKQILAIIHEEMLTIKPAAPTLEIKEPKQKKKG